MRRIGTARSFGFLRRRAADAGYARQLGLDVEIWESPDGRLYAWPQGVGDRAEVECIPNVTGGETWARYEYLPRVLPP